MCLYEGLRLKQTLRKKVRGGPPTTPTTFVQAAGVLLEEILTIEQEKAKERKEANLKQNDRAGNVSDSDEGEAREKAAEKVNADVSGRTLEKGKKVKDKAESDDEPELAATNTRVWLLKPENDSAVAHGRGEPVWQKPLLPNRETPTNSPFEPLRDNYCYSRRV